MKFEPDVGHLILFAAGVTSTYYFGGFRLSDDAIEAITVGALATAIVGLAMLIGFIASIEWRSWQRRKARSGDSE